MFPFILVSVYLMVSRCSILPKQDVSFSAYTGIFNFDVNKNIDIDPLNSHREVKLLRLDIENRESCNNQATVEGGHVSTTNSIFRYLDTSSLIYLKNNSLNLKTYDLEISISKTQVEAFKLTNSKLIIIIEFQNLSSYTSIYISLPYLYSKTTENNSLKTFTKIDGSKDFVMFQCMLFSFFGKCQDIWQIERFFVSLNEILNFMIGAQFLIKNDNCLKLLKDLDILNQFYDCFPKSFDYTITKTDEKLFKGFKQISETIFPNLVGYENIAHDLFQDFCNIILMTEVKDYKWKIFIFDKNNIFKGRDEIILRKTD